MVHGLSCFPKLNNYNMIITWLIQNYAEKWKQIKLNKQKFSQILFYGKFDTPDKRWLLYDLWDTWTGLGVTITSMSSHAALRFKIIMCALNLPCAWRSSKKTGISVYEVAPWSAQWNFRHWVVFTNAYISYLKMGNDKLSDFCCHWFSQQDKKETLKKNQNNKINKDRCTKEITQNFALTME